MKLLLNRSRAKKLQKILTSKNKLICALLYLAGVIGIALFADMRVNQNSFVSENALLPGYVVTKYQQQSVAVSLNKEFSSLTDRSERHQWIIEKFTGLGVEVYTQNFTVNRPLVGDKISGDNIYAIYRAPKVASTEAVVFSTTLKDSQFAIPLMLSLCHLISKQTIWAKDVIFLISEEEEYGIGAWLQSYHDINTLPYITASPVLTHSGAIQAALHLDMPVYSFDRIRMYVEAINGQLPDIDLVVLVRQICRQERIELLLRNAPHDIGDFLGNLLGLHANMAWQAAGRVSFPSALYHPYNIHAVGVQTESVLRRNRFSWQHIGRFTESVLRSVNNLEEQFHTAYYFYLMPCIERFVCLSVYMIPCGLLLASAAAKVLSLWFQCGTKSDVVGAKMFFSDIDVNTIDCVYPLIHGILFGLINQLATSVLTQSNMMYVLVATQAVVLSSVVLTKVREDWRLHQAFVLLLHVLTIVLLCMLNISLTIFYAIPTTLVYLLQFPTKKTGRVVQSALLLAVNPLVLVLEYSYVYVYLHLPDQLQGSVLGAVHEHATSVIESKYTLGVWTWSAYSYLLLPVWALQWTLHLPDISEVKEIEMRVRVRRLLPMRRLPVRRLPVRGLEMERIKLSSNMDYGVGKCLLM
ncbi:glycosylphosphatidylinositol anchor attachment 1 protein-like [Bolinopsis microptera]|uniref:glycosylphosphatidylinositol anchor attachment 1 protein-like n=1 Tax=Bolinopsis microptera TaxID=2820187 RepID=UPI00307A4961